MAGAWALTDLLDQSAGLVRVSIEGERELPARVLEHDRGLPVIGTARDLAYPQGDHRTLHRCSRQAVLVEGWLPEADRRGWLAGTGAMPGAAPPPPDRALARGD
jgi:hypothetical protein